MLPENEYSEIESRYYLNPQIALDESNNFIENLRSTQQQNTAQIARDTEQLGTAVSSNLGGLGGSTDYWAARYSTPQTNAVVENLRSVAQAQALNQALQNEQEIWKKRYNDAYRKYQKSAYDKTNSPTDPDSNDGGTEEEISDELTGLDAKQDTNDYTRKPTATYSTEVAWDNRSTERDKKIKVYKNSNGNVDTVIVNGVPHYGRDARARYRYLKNAGLVE